MQAPADTIITSTPATVKWTSLGDYPIFLERVKARFLKNTDNGKRPVFATTATGLWEMYLDGIADPVERQHKNCRTCKKFIETYGTLAVVDEDGILRSLMWDEEDAPESLRLSIANMAKTVRRAEIKTAYFSPLATWGTAVTGDWSHLSVDVPPMMRFRHPVMEAHQLSAEKIQEFNSVKLALSEYTVDHLTTAVQLLNAEALYRTEKVLGPAQWLLERKQEQVNTTGTQRQDNLLWKAIATAPSGFCHPRSSMIATLLDDIAAGKDFEAVKRSFDAKMNPTVYMRPQTGPSAGEIAAAEKLFEQLSSGDSLRRRFARLDEVKAIWKPAPKKEEKATGDGLFSHLKLKTDASSSEKIALQLPPKLMTWEKFASTVLPTAERIQLHTPIYGAYAPLVTAANMDAPPIIQWDTEENRNPVSWYFRSNGCSARTFGLASDVFVEVEAVTMQPSMWNGGFEHQGAGVMFILQGAHETQEAGAALFPEILKTEYRGIRSVLEAYSNHAKIEGINEPHAAGVMLNKNRAGWDQILKVWSDGKASTYKLDRWE